MVILTVSRYGKKIESKHNAILNAAMQAIAELDNDMSYPVCIKENDEILWQSKSPFDDSIKRLREIAECL